MKTIYKSLMPVVVVALSINAASSAPIFNSNEGIDYMVGSSMLTPLSLAFSYSDMDRDVMIKDYPRPRVMKTVTSTGVLGVDLFRFITLYGLAGGNNTDFGDGMSSSKGEYGVGIRINLLDHEIPDPLLTEDRIRINASIQQTRVKSEFANDDLKWSDTTATVLMSLVNDLDGDSQYFPESMAIYAGISHSTLDGDISEQKASWFLVGLEMYYTKHISFNLGADLGGQGNEGVHAGVNLRF